MAMPKFSNNQLIARFQDFRQKLYNCFESCSDACMDLLDALAGNTGANSIAELSLSPLFPNTARLRRNSWWNQEKNIRGFITRTR